MPAGHLPILTVTTLKTQVHFAHGRTQQSLSPIAQATRANATRLQGGGPLEQLQLLHLHFTFLFPPVYLHLLHAMRLHSAPLQLAAHICNSWKPPLMARLLEKAPRRMH